MPELTFDADTTDFWFYLYFAFGDGIKFKWSGLMFYFRKIVSDGKYSFFFLLWGRSMIPLKNFGYIVRSPSMGGFFWMEEYARNVPDNEFSFRII